MSGGADPRVVDAFRNAMRRYASTVTILTAADRSLRHGITATAVTSVSMDPPSLLVCVYRKGRFYEVLMSSMRFCVNVLNHNQSDLSAVFSSDASPQERFKLGSWLTTEDGLSILRSAQANIICRKAAVFPFGSHSIVVGEVDEVRESGDGAPLLYQNSSYCLSTPKPSTSTLKQHSGHDH